MKFKNKLLFGLVFFLCFFLHPIIVKTVSAANSYYVDSNQTVDGNGLQTNPWNNINGHVNELRSGDIMYLRGSSNPSLRQKYQEDVGITNVNDCVDGASGNLITITNYPGDGFWQAAFVE